MADRTRLALMIGFAVGAASGSVVSGAALAVIEAVKAEQAPKHEYVCRDGDGGGDNDRGQPEWFVCELADNNTESGAETPDGKAAERANTPTKPQEGKGLISRLVVDPRENRADNAEQTKGEHPTVHAPASPETLGESI